MSINLFGKSWFYNKLVNRNLNEIIRKNILFIEISEASDGVV